MKKSLILIMMVWVVFGCQPKKKGIQIDHVFSKIETQVKYQLKQIDQLKTDKLISPRSVDEQGDLHLVPVWEWTVGFFPGSLWMLYDYSKDDFWRQQAELYTEALESQQYNDRTHDTGFMMYCSYGRGLELNNSSAYRAVLIQSANSLASRYSENVKAIKSWSWNEERWRFPVIIDNMMNLELLFWASNATGDSSYKEIAVKHALTTMQHHFRSDNSSYHLVDYDPETGEVIKKETVQGFADESAWSRGQAWGLYGYTMCYRETGMPVFLEQAEKIAEYIMNNPNLPADKIPYWDYNVTDKASAPRDASAAAVTASALLELAQFSTKGNEYIHFATKVLTNLSGEPYFAKAKTNAGFILKHSTGSIPHNSEIDVPLVYADYYYMEALLRLQALRESTK